MRKLQWDRGLRYDYSLRNLKWAAKEKKKKRNDKRLCVIFSVAWINVNIDAMSHRGVIPSVVNLLLHVKGFMCYFPANAEAKTDLKFEQILLIT